MGFHADQHAGDYDADDLEETPTSATELLPCCPFCGIAPSVNPMHADIVHHPENLCLLAGRIVQRERWVPRAAPSPAAFDDQSEDEDERMAASLVNTVSSLAEAGAFGKPAAHEDAEAAFEQHWENQGYASAYPGELFEIVGRALFAAGRASALGVKPYDISASNERQSEFYRAAGGRKAPEDELREAAQGEEEANRG